MASNAAKDPDSRRPEFLDRLVSRFKSKKNQATDSQPQIALTANAVETAKPITPAVSDLQPFSSRSLIVNQALDKDTNDLWQIAYDQTNKETQELIGNVRTNGNGNAKDYVDQLANWVRNAENRYRDDTAKIRVGDRDILWRDYARKVTTCLTVIGDAGVILAPQPAPVIWPALKGLLKVNASQCEDIAAILGCADAVLRLVRRGRIYEVVFSLDTVKKDAEGEHSGKPEFRKLLIEVYQRTLELLAYAYERLIEGVARQFLRALTAPEEGETAVTELSKLSQELSEMAQAFGIRSRDAYSKEHLRLLQSLEHPLRRIDNGVAEMLQSINDGIKTGILNSISGIQVSKWRVPKSEKRTKGTGQWLIKDEKFLEWENSSWSSILWLKGKVGSGKSFLTSKVVDNYVLDPSRTVANVPQNDEGLAYFYCSRTIPGHGDAKAILQSYIVQLSQISNKIHESLYSLYVTPGSQQPKAQQPTLKLEDCKEILSKVASTYSQTTLILDALDECDRESRMHLITFFRKLVEGSTRPVKIFVSSRPEADIDKHTSSRSLIEISTGRNQHDIELYVKSRSFPEQWKEPTRQLVEQTLIYKSNGMFKWVELQWEQLKDLKSNATIKKRLSQLPKDLMETYKEIYDQQEDYDQVILQRAIKWMQTLGGFLRGEILLSAVRVPCEGQVGFPIGEEIDEQTLSSICRHLLFKKGNYWVFSHASVSEFFNDYFETNNEDWVQHMVISMIRLISNCQWSDYSRMDDMGVYADGLRMHDSNIFAPQNLLQHHLRSGDQCLHHVRSAYHQNAAAEELTDELAAFFGVPGYPSDSPYGTWIRKEHEGYSDFFPVQNPVFGICYFGFLELLRHCYNEETLDVNQVNDEGCSLLQIAAAGGHESMCSYLLDQNCEIDRITRSEYETALRSAIDARWLPIVELLLNRGANPNLGVTNTPLCHAATQFLEAVPILLESGANPNLRDLSASIYKTPLEAVLSSSSNFVTRSPAATVAALRSILAYGAEVETYTENHGHLLAFAAFNGSVDCVRVLVEEANINVNASMGKPHESALRAAILGEGRLDIVRYLVEEAGADSIPSSSLETDFYFYQEDRYNNRKHQRVSKSRKERALTRFSEKVKYMEEQNKFLV